MRVCCATRGSWWKLAKGPVEQQGMPANWTSLYASKCPISQLLPLLLHLFRAIVHGAFLAGEYPARAAKAALLQEWKW